MNILFVGGGNMGRALTGGLLAQGATRDSIAVVEIDATARGKIAAEFGVAAVPEFRRDAGFVPDVIVFAVKPQHMRQTAMKLASELSSQLVISIAAGIRIADLARWLGGYTRIVRAMPNTPALIRRGISGLFAHSSVAADERAGAEAVLAAVGQVIWCEREEQIDAITAVSGSGPAYVFHFLESMIEAAEGLGFSHEQSRQLAYATASGAIALAEAASDPPSVLRAQVTSKAGTTEAALRVLDERAVKAAYAAAIRAADARAAELGDLLGRDG
jgi:pyrroline-5-carboxylate reductase